MRPTWGLFCEPGHIFVVSYVHSSIVMIVSVIKLLGSPQVAMSGLSSRLQLPGQARA